MNGSLNLDGLNGSYLNGPMDGGQFQYLYPMERILHYWSHAGMKTFERRLWRYELTAKRKPNRLAIFGEVIHLAYVGKDIGGEYLCTPVSPNPLDPPDIRFRYEIPDRLRKIFEPQPDSESTDTEEG